MRTPNSARRETVFILFWATWAQLITAAYKYYTGIILATIISKSHISYWVLGIVFFFLMSRYAGIILYYSEVCWRGYTGYTGYTPKASPIMIYSMIYLHVMGYVCLDKKTSQWLTLFHTYPMIYYEWFMWWYGICLGYVHIYIYTHTCIYDCVFVYIYTHTYNGICMRVFMMIYDNQITLLKHVFALRIGEHCMVIVEDLWMVNCETVDRHISIYFPTIYHFSMWAVINIES